MSTSPTIAALLDESIQLELNLAKLYTLFNDHFEEDEEFWWQLSMEERSHAALLQQERKNSRSRCSFFRKISLPKTSTP